MVLLLCHALLIALPDRKELFMFQLDLAPFMPIIALVAYVALVALAVFLVTHTNIWYARAKATELHAKRRYGVQILGIFLGIMMAFITFINVSTFVAAHHYDGTSHAVSTHDVAKLFGFNSGKAYPLTLNESEDAFDANGDRFGITLYGGVWQDQKLGPVVLADFTRPEGTTHLSIPVSKLVFIDSEVAAPSATLNLAELTSYSYGRMVVDVNPHCDPVVRSALLVCNREITSTPRMNAKTAEGGLGTLINTPDMVATTQFVVTPAMHALIRDKMRKSE